MKITLRADDALRDALRRRAALGKSLSELAREILEEAMAVREVSARAGHLRGRLDLSSASPDSARGVVRERNWRP